MTEHVIRHRVAAGCATFSLADARDDANAIATLRAARDAGIQIFDSARAYATETDSTHNEQLLYRALGSDESVLLMTKGGHFRTGARTWDVDNSPERLRRDVDDSLRALRVERLGLYFVHRADGPIDIQDSFGALEDLRRQGKIKALGISNATTQQIEDAHRVAALSAVQNRLVAGHTSDTLECAARLGLAFFAYSPLGGGDGARELPRRFPRLSTLAHARGVSPHRLVLRGMLAQSPAISVIVGTGSPQRARENAAVQIDGWDADADDAWDADVAEQLSEVRGSA